MSAQWSDPPPYAPVIDLGRVRERRLTARARGIRRRQRKVRAVKQWFGAYGMPVILCAAAYLFLAVVVLRWLVIP